MYSFRVSLYVSSPAHGRFGRLFFRYIGAHCIWDFVMVFAFGEMYIAWLWLYFNCTTWFRMGRDDTLVHAHTQTHANTRTRVRIVKCEWNMIRVHYSDAFNALYILSVPSVCLGELFRMRYYLGAVFICLYLVELLGAGNFYTYYIHSIRLYIEYGMSSFESIVWLYGFICNTLKMTLQMIECAVKHGLVYFYVVSVARQV